MSNRKLAIIMVTTVLIVMLVLLISACTPDRVNGYTIEDSTRFVKLEGYQYYVNGSLLYPVEDTVTGILYMMGSDRFSHMIDADGSPITKEEFIKQEEKRLNLR